MSKSDQGQVNESKALEHIDVLESIVEQEQEQESDDLLQSIDEEVQSSAAQEAVEEAARQGAAFAVGMVESLVKMRWGFVQVDDATKNAITEKAVPVFRKYGGELPVWLQPWKEEVELGIVLGVAGFGVYSQVKAHSAKEAMDNENENKTD